MATDSSLKGESTQDLKESLTLEQLQERAPRLAISLEEMTQKPSGPDYHLLGSLKQSAYVLKSIRQELIAAKEMEYTLTLSADWLLDNTHVIEGSIEEVKRNLPQSFIKKLPVVFDNSRGKINRSYLIAKEFVELTGSKINRANLIAFFKSYQTGSPMTIGELWATPLMIRLTLIEHLQSLALKIGRRLKEGERANFWGIRLIQARHQDPDRLPLFLADLRNEVLRSSVHFAEDLLDHLFDEETVLPLVRDLLSEAFHANITEVIHQEQIQKISDQAAISNAIVSLITLSQLSWPDIFETISPVDAILDQDPAQIYSQMDFKTRDLYRHSIEIIAHLSKMSELAVANLILQMAKDGIHEGSPGDHVGYYLIDDGRPLLEARLNYQPTILQALRRWMMFHPALVYFFSIGLMMLFTYALMFDDFGRPSFLFLFLSLIAFFPVSEWSVQIINLFFSLFLNPLILPKMSFKKGIPESCKTLIVTPMLLTTDEVITAVIKRLEIHYLANSQDHLVFGIFFDFTDASQESMESDQPLLEKAISGIQALETRYGVNKFFLLHRKRVWSESEQAWIGWERKRGKLEELNRYLLGKHAGNIVIHGDPDALKNIRYVITLDADTQLQRDTARHLIEVIAHPLNSPHVSSQGTITRGYSIIQPRVSTGFSPVKHTLFYRIFSDVHSVDPYSPAISNVYQDLVREGSYHGKGIYDLHAFHAVLSGRFPQERILSHDLIEGSFARVGFASDVSVYDLFPEDYLSWSQRQHRWMRGDWQIIDWLFPTTPNSENQKVVNQLSLISRWKIFDNLRRALMPVAIASLLVISWIWSANIIWTLLAVLVILIPAISLFLCKLLTHPKVLIRTWDHTVNDFVRRVVDFVLLPYQAYLSLDALCRAAYRRLISQRHLLEWTTFDHQFDEQDHRKFILQLTEISTLVFLILGVVYLLHPQALLIALPVCLIWMSAPILIYFLDKKNFRLPVTELTDQDKGLLRKVARKTWRYFDDFVGPKTHWLPPDNYQAALKIEVAPRTSPTNIGLWMLSALSAYDLHYLTCDEVVERLLATCSTLKKLDRHNGHLLNWYQIETLRPLYPRYVSTVDSGNLLACLWTLEQGIHEILSAPVFPHQFVQGLWDSYREMHEEITDDDLKLKLGALKELLEVNPADLERFTSALRKGSELVKTLLAETEARWLDKLDQELSGWDSLFLRYFGWTDILKVIPNKDLARVDFKDLFSLTSTLRSSSETIKTLLVEPNSYWLRKLDQEFSGWISLFSRYFGWIDLLQTIPKEHRAILEKEPTFAELMDKSRLLSLDRLAAGELNKLYLFQKNDFPADTQPWVNKLREALETAKWLAGEKIGQAWELVKQIRELSQECKMQFLYDQERRVFSIGYQVDECKLDSSYYDLLASEARTASLVAIAKGEVPIDHWWALGRPYRFLNGQEVLLSWGGTMFEYLMPSLLIKHNAGSLLGEACHAAVTCQMIYGRKRGIPWGISESAFSEIDVNHVYQYRSFGIPGMGLKRGLEEDLVVSPYSTALALAIDPVSAIKNMRRLNQAPREMLSRYGYYESIDFTRQGSPDGHRGVIVYAYMAHHQGMTLVSIANILHDQVMPKRFHADSRISGVESLVFEQIPLFPAITHGYKREPPITKLMPFPIDSNLGKVDTAHSHTPHVNLLSNGKYSVMMTNAGGGYSRWQDLDITRWRADTTCDQWGSFCYVKDCKDHSVWSTTFQPTHQKSSSYAAMFKADKVEIRRRDHGIDTLLELVVSPEDNAEIRLITLANLSEEIRTLELTSYSELALAPHAADRVHPCFNQLFIETEALPQLSGLLAFRRLRSSEETPVWAVHTIASSQSDEEVQTLGFHYETDRGRFIGRGRTLKNPVALEGDLSNSHGTVLDPIFSIRKKVVLQPGQRVQVSYITAMTDDRDAAVNLIHKYRDIASSHRAIEVAWTSTQLELRHLRMHQEEVQLFNQLASCILYPQARLRASADRLKRNQLGQSRLWGHGLSGDLPVVAVTIADERELDLIKQLLTAHAFWRLRGLRVDLVILNEAATSYDQPLLDQLKRMIQLHVHSIGAEKLGEVFLISSDQIPDEELTLILATARVFLIAARGSLRQQLASPVLITKHAPGLVPRKGIRDEPSQPLPYLELPYFNGLGGYTPNGKEYAIYLSPGLSTPSPWINVVANSQFGTLVSETGLGCTWAVNSQTNRLTPWSNDPVLNPASDAVYLRDDELGTFWTPTAEPIRELDAYRARHGQGYTHYEHNSHGIEQLLTVFVPLDDQGGLSLRVQRMRLINRSDRHRLISLMAYSEWVLGTNKEETQMHVRTEYDPESQALFAYNPYNPDFSHHVAFSFSNQTVKSYTADRAEFLGRNHTPSNPAALRRTLLNGASGPGMDPCSVLHVMVELAPGEQKEVEFILGYAATVEEARQMIFACRNPGWTERAFAETQAWWDRLLGSVQVETSDMAINFAVNRWLLYQDLSCRVWGRSAFYQSAGAYGFRDQLQDVMALVYSAPYLTRAQILKAASRQFVEGDVQHWWHEPSGGGVRTRITDDLLWLPLALAHYVRVTRDLSILEETVPFLTGELLKDGQQEAYFIPGIAAEKGTLIEHCRRAIAKSAGVGPHRLPLMGGGDWNDGMNRVGILGQGESVWLGWFIIQVMNDFAELLEESGKPEAGEGFRIQAKRIAENIEANAWDGQWYCRAYFDNGKPLGSKTSFEACIDSLSQSWAVISGAGDPARTDQALKSVEERLVLRNENLVLLLTPPFDKSNLDPGYIKGYPPGVRENGGQYTHGSLWVALAFARKGDGDKAVELLRMMSPVDHSRDLSALALYRVEPYVVAGDIYALPGQVGRGGWTWYTGSAGWMYRIWIEEIFGLKLRGNVLKVMPTLPKDWNCVKLNYRHGNTQYEITIENPPLTGPKGVSLEIDGVRAINDEIHLVDDGNIHQVKALVLEVNR